MASAAVNQILSAESRGKAEQCFVFIDTHSPGWNGLEPLCEIPLHRTGISTTLFYKKKKSLYNHFKIYLLHCPEKKTREANP